jgi:hypothetical protein
MAKVRRLVKVSSDIGFPEDNYDCCESSCALSASVNNEKQTSIQIESRITRPLWRGFGWITVSAWLVGIKCWNLNRDRIGRTVPLVHRARQSLANGETQSLIIMPGIVPKNRANNQAVILCMQFMILSALLLAQPKTIKNDADRSP